MHPGHQVIQLPFVESTMSRIFLCVAVVAAAAAILSNKLLPALDNLQLIRIALSMPLKFESAYIMGRH